MSKQALKAILCLLSLFAILANGTVPVAFHPPRAYAEAPHPPTPSAAPTSTPPKPEGKASTQKLPLPAPGDLPLAVEQARARQAMQAALDKYLRYWGPRYQAAPLEVTVEGGWAHGFARTLSTRGRYYGGHDIAGVN